MSHSNAIPTGRSLTIKPYRKATPMPRTTPDIVDAASRCFHFNATDLIPSYIVIYSPHNDVYALQTRNGFLTFQLTHPTSDWRVALDLPPEALLALMGAIPHNKSSKLNPAKPEDLPETAKPIDSDTVPQDTASEPSPDDPSLDFRSNAELN